MSYKSKPVSFFGPCENHLMTKEQNTMAVSQPGPLQKSAPGYKDQAVVSYSFTVHASGKDALVTGKNAQKRYHVQTLAPR